MPAQQRDRAGSSVSMRPGWHIGQTPGVSYFLKKGAAVSTATCGSTLDASLISLYFTARRAQPFEIPT
ncbi:MAG: hypothetical protein DCC57_06480 [Chloroflexi bacterium]|nr:MAG: hypothetical protein DCC57_06480 [Chloroflexota bacterium]